MSKSKKESKNSTRVFVILIGIFILLWSGVSISIYEFGDVTEARDIKVSRREWSRQDEASDGKNYRFDVSYTYTVDGVDYSGIDTSVRGEWLGAQYDNTVHYLPFAPRISSIYAEEMNSIGVLIPIGFGVALIIFGAIPQKKMSRNTKKATSNRGVVALNSERPVTMTRRMDNTAGYDDQLEEYDQNGIETRASSWKCICGKRSTGNFCAYCGKQR